MKSKYGFTTAAKKLIKKEDRVMCGIADDGKVIVLTAYYAWRMTPAEYDELMLPVLKRPAGNWSTYKEDAIVSQKAIEMWTRMCIDAAKHTLHRTPCLFRNDDTGRLLQAFRDNESGVTAIYNDALLEAFPEDIAIAANSAVSPGFVYADDGTDSHRLLGIIMPVRPAPKQVKAIDAYFADI